MEVRQHITMRNKSSLVPYEKTRWQHQISRRPWSKEQDTHKVVLQAVLSDFLWRCCAIIVLHNGFCDEAFLDRASFEDLCLYRSCFCPCGSHRWLRWLGPSGGVHGESNYQRLDTNAMELDRVPREIKCKVGRADTETKNWCLKLVASWPCVFVFDDSVTPQGDLNLADSMPKAQCAQG